MIGEKYGRLTVLSLSHCDQRHRKWWLCLCECGSNTTLHTGNLRSGNTRSCGCLARDAKAARRISVHHSDITAVILGYKRHALRRGHAWSLTRDEVERLIGLDCFYCGSPPSNTKITKNTVEPLRYNGIDRLDNAAGYERANTVPCCRICNRAKETLPVDEFSVWAKRLGAMAEQWGAVAGDERLAA